MLARHVDAYFRHVHSTGCYGFVHEPTLRRSIRAGTVSRPLILAMCAASKRFIHWNDREAESADASMLSRSQTWADESKRLVFTRLYDYELDTLAALLLQFYDAVASAQFEVVRLLSPVAARMAIGMDLNVEEDDVAGEEQRRTGTTVERDEAEVYVRRETKRRLMWACQYFDWQTHEGLSFNLCIDPDCMTIRLPSTDEDYLAGRANDMPMLSTRERAGQSHSEGPSTVGPQSPLSAFIRLMAIRVRVMQ